MGWSISPSGENTYTGEKFASIDQNGVITFSANTKSDRTFIVTYNDEQGNSTSETITQQMCDDYQYPNQIDIGVRNEESSEEISWDKRNVGAIVETDYGDYVSFNQNTNNVPFLKDLEKLITQTNYTWVEDFNGSGVNGGLFEGQGRYIFVPAGGIDQGNGLEQLGNLGYLISRSPSNTVNTKCYSLRVSPSGCGIYEIKKTDIANTRIVYYEEIN